MNMANRSDMDNIQITRDSSQPQIAIVKFHGDNYLTWSKSVLIYIQGKDNKDYLNGEMEVPSRSDPQYRKWKTECDQHEIDIEFHETPDR